jgi:hypothetical protein
MHYWKMYHLRTIRINNDERNKFKHLSAQKYLKICSQFAT